MPTTLNYLSITVVHCRTRQLSYGFDSQHLRWNAVQRLDFDGMRVGIDFGTTHTVAAIVDRGNYPVVSFDGVDTWPSLVAANAAGDLRFGLDAAAVRHDSEWSVLRSFKHLLNNAGPQSEVTLGGRAYRLSA